MGKLQGMPGSWTDLSPVLLPQNRQERGGNFLDGSLSTRTSHLYVKLPFKSEDGFSM